MLLDPETVRHHFGWTFSGVDFDLPGNGGPECVNFIPFPQKVLETLIFVGLSLMWMAWAYPRVKLPAEIPEPSRIDSTMKRVVLMMMSVAFGIELGFKFATHQLIWILNPCHIVSMMQIFLLVAPPSKFTMTVFRVHMHCLQGATIAFIFPVVNTRLLPFETSVYYVQHLMMLVVPFYLMRVGGVYTTEALSDFTYVFAALGYLFFYHFTFMQLLSHITQVNLNNMMCPAISDPFYGRYYRVCAVTHQFALITLHGKLYTFVARKILPRLPRKRTGSSESRDVTVNGNGHNVSHAERCHDVSHAEIKDNVITTDLNGYVKAHAH